MDADLRNVVNLDRLIHEPARLLIVTMLYAVDCADFTFLLRQAGLTKGNLSAHLSRLEDAGYVDVEKAFRGRMPRTTYRLTPKGREAFQEYRESLRRAVESMPE